MKFKNFSTLVIPAVYIMSRLQYTQKFFLLSILFSIPIILGLYSFISEINVEINKTRTEKLGLHTIEPIQHLLQHVQQHRGMAIAYLGGESELEKPLLEKRQEIEQDFIDIERANQEFVSASGPENPRFKETSANLQNLKNEWDQISEKIDSGTLATSLESYRLHTALAQNILVAIAYIGDDSGLILDPYLGTYYLIDPIIRSIPLISEQLGEARGLGSMISKGRELSPDEKQTFNSILTTVNTNVGSLNRGMEIAFIENASVQENLSGGLKDVVLQTSGFLNFINKEIVDTKVFGVQSDEYYQIATKAIDGTFEFYADTSSELLLLFDQRIKELEAKRNIITLAVGLIMLFVAYLFLGFYLGLQKVIVALRQTTEEMVSGGGGASISLDTKDELGEVASLFNRLAQALTRSNMELKETLAKQLKTEEALEVRAVELEKFNRLMVGRELKMVELKKEIAELKEKLPPTS
ncbi:MAG: hypothetical protein AAB628_03330 [Patescibacteria group bacterium]